MKGFPPTPWYGIHTARALENFPLAGRPVHPELARAYGMVKLACAQTNRRQGAWSDDAAKADAIERACLELGEGRLAPEIVVDLLQGGAGTSTNMNVNEVLANRALELLGEPRGAYGRVSPLADLNRHQSTNDTYPTALRLAAIRLLQRLEPEVVALQESFQALEKRFAQVVKVGRTQLQDAVLTTLGREFGAYAEAINRDRWRIYKCEERLRVVNLGGTAIGTGLAAPRQFIFSVVETLRELTGIGFARAENLVDATQNADVFVEVSGILKAHAVSLIKICSDLRLLSSGPDSGLGEIRLPARQAGSSIMPGKVNPVIPEAVTQVALLAMGHDTTIAAACAAGTSSSTRSCRWSPPACWRTSSCWPEPMGSCAGFASRASRPNEARCRQHVESSTAVATALLPALGYERAGDAARQAAGTGQTVRQVVLEQDG